REAEGAHARRRRRAGPRSHVGDRARSRGGPRRARPPRQGLRRRHRAEGRPPPAPALRRPEERPRRVHESIGRSPRGEVMKSFRRVALAYSGGLDTSIIIPWLKETHGCEVVAVAVNVGQEEET